ncbi:hypothetical protein L484_018331 [Morus notabilis]|uniref:Uncharacterized protein n=1 Tax=Morus notabilis TaxID=981085 RepID=W9QRD8_9ROSA|nr:hypothetical protein L484_018331 [Morus notabilis]
MEPVSGNCLGKTGVVGSREGKNVALLGPRRLILAQKKASLMLDSDYLMIRRRDEKLPDDSIIEEIRKRATIWHKGFSSLA